MLMGGLLFALLGAPTMADEELPKIQILQAERGAHLRANELPKLPEEVSFGQLIKPRYSYDVELRDLFYANAKYHALLDNRFESMLIWRTEIEQYRAVDERELDTLHTLSYLSGYRVGEQALNYGLLPERATEIEYYTNQELPTDLYRTNLLALADNYYRKGLSTDVIGTLKEASSGSESQAQDRLEYLAHSEYLERQYEEAADDFDRISPEDDDDLFFALAPHNYGSTLVKTEDVDGGFQELLTVGEIDGGNDPLLWAVKDRANLALAYYLLETGIPQEALTYFERVRIVGPYSNPALLGTGWAHLASGNFEQALVPWLRLQKNEITDPYVLETYVGIPYAYSRLEIYGRSALNFGKAIDALEAEQLNVEDSMTAIRAGHLLDKLDRQEWIDYGNAWLYQLREEQDSPESRYLLALMTQREFQQALSNYRDTLDLEKRLDTWDIQLAALLEIVRERRNFYTRLLAKLQPRLEAVFQRITEIVLRTDEISRELLILLDQPQPVKLATTNEIEVRRELDAIARSVEPARGQPDMVEAMIGIDRLYGILDWEQLRFYYRRLTNAINASEELRPIIEQTQALHEATKRDLLIATSSYLGHETTIRRLRAQVKRLTQRATGMRTLQGQYLNELALVVLDEHLYRINTYLFKSRFAVAEAYDRKISVDKAALLKASSTSTEADDDQTESQTSGDQPQTAAESDTTPEAPTTDGSIAPINQADDAPTESDGQTESQASDDQPNTSEAVDGPPEAATPDDAGTTTEDSVQEVEQP